MAKIRIVVDAMGGDHAPSEIVKGAVLASNEARSIHIILVGTEEAIKETLSMHNSNDDNKPSRNLQVYPAQDLIHMDEEAPRAVRSKKDSSIVVSARLVRDNQADAFVSAGNTGAAMSAALILFGRVKGISRPAVAVTIPTARRPVILLDAGANIDCRPQNLLQFGKLGSVYAKNVLGIDNPSVGLLNIGEEKGKGSSLIRKAYHLLEHSDLNFLGNVEGRDLPKGKVDVAVCDGFVGNLILKTMEGLAEVVFSEIRSQTNSSVKGKVGSFLLNSSLRKLKKRLDYNEYGGAQLLGVKKVCVISHGSSKAQAIKNAILTAAQTVSKNFVSQMEKEI